MLRGAIGLRAGRAGTPARWGGLGFRVPALLAVSPDLRLRQAFIFTCQILPPGPPTQLSPRAQQGQGNTWRQWRKTQAGERPRRGASVGAVGAICTRAPPRRVLASSPGAPGAAVA